jgi:hypothetical protein
MAAETPTHVEFDAPPGAAPMWIGLAGPPILWLINFQISYALVPWCCSHGHRWWIHLSNALFLLLTIACGVVGWRDHSQTSADLEAKRVGGIAGARRLMIMMGIAGCVLFSLIILLQGIAGFVIDPCYD